jgi:hypothetical protein
MQFIYPSFLFALLAVLIPVIIHLFRFRRYRKVYFSNVRLIEDLKLETQRRSKLRHLLVLIARMLAIACLVLAFAQPYIPLQEGETMGSRRSVAVFLDNSFSMESVSSEGTLIQLGKDKATVITRAYGPADQFALYTNDFEGRHQRFYSNEDFQDLVQSVEISPVSRSLEEVMARAADLFREEGVKGDLYILSDFQRGMVGSQLPVPDSVLRAFFLPLQANELSNLYIDSCWFATPALSAGQQAALAVRVVNAGNSDYEKVPLRLRLNGEQRAVASVDVPAGQSAELQLSFRLDEAGWHSGALEITDYPVTYDDIYHLAFPVIERIPVLTVYDGNPSPYLRALFGNDSLVLYQESAALSLDYSSLGKFSLVILQGLNTISSGLAGELSAYTEGGGSLVFFPGDDADLPGLNLFLNSLGFAGFDAPDTANTRLSDLDPDQPLFGGVFESVAPKQGERLELPQVMSHYPLLISPGSSSRVILSMDNGRPFLAEGKTGAGQTWLFSVPLLDEWTTLPRHAIVVPLLYRMALLSRPVQRLSYTVGRDQNLLIPGITSLSEVLTLKHLEGKQEVIPEIRRQGNDMLLLTHDQIKTDGVYSLSEKGGVLAYTAFNYDRRESALDPLDASALLSMVTEQGIDGVEVLSIPASATEEVIAKANQGKRYWKWLIWAALGFLLIEILLLRFIRA